MGALMYGATQREAVCEFIKKRGCSEAAAERFLKIAQLTLGVASLDNDAEASYSWDYAAVLWDGVRTEKVREAFAKLSYREQTMLEKALRSLHDLRSRIEFEASSPRTAERAYRRAVEKLTLNLVGLGALHAVCIEHIALETVPLPGRQRRRLGRVRA